MLGKETFSKKIDELLIVFPNWGFDKTNPSHAKVWYEKFKKMEDKQFSLMVDSYIKNNKFNPTIAGLLEYKSKNYVPNERNADLIQLRKDAAEQLQDGIL